MTDAKVKTDGPCLRCRIGQHEVCYKPDDENDTCCDGGAQYEAPVATDPLAILASGGNDAEDDDEGEKRGNRSGARGSDRNLKDQQSTGRKRAAIAFPLNKEAPCEWAGLAKAGGGPFPIVGCDPSENRTQTHRHHGPDKNTLNNEQGNVHRICAFCHNRWHAKNDPHYVPGNIVNPHDPHTRASSEDRALVGLEEAQTANLKVRD